MRVIFRVRSHHTQDKTWSRQMPTYRPGRVRVKVKVRVRDQGLGVRVRG
jgi:hypothetical protein